MPVCTHASMYVCIVYNCIHAYIVYTDDAHQRQILDKCANIIIFCLFSIFAGNIGGRYLITREAEGTTCALYMLWVLKLLSRSDPVYVFVCMYVYGLCMYRNEQPVLGAYVITMAIQLCGNLCPGYQPWQLSYVATFALAINHGNLVMRRPLPWLSTMATQLCGKPQTHNII